MIFRTIWDKLKFYFLYIICFQGDNIAFLRHQGVEIGSSCSISTSVNNFGSEPWLIEVGDDVTITDGVVFLTHDGSSRLFRKEFVEMNPKFGNRFGAIRIHENCFIGMRSILMPDIEVGPNSIIGAGSVVTHDVPPNCVIAGNPARIICSLDEYVTRYKNKMIPLEATTREALKKELLRELNKRENRLSS